MTSVPPKAPLSAPEAHDVIIIGTGFSGLGMAIRLKQSGRNDFLILEKAGDIGGTWRDNHYPGAACDVPSHLYSFSFEPNPQWSRMFSPQPEIKAYMEHCAQKYGLMPHVRCHAEVTELRWNEDQARWRVRIADGRQFSARVVISGIGGLSRPALPRVPGLEQFQGTVFHSAQWNHDVDLAGKRVAVVGTGASAIQFIPEIAPRAGRLFVFQRTPPWVLPKPDRRMRTEERRVFSRLPLAQRLLRSRIYWQNEAFGLGFVNPQLMKAAAWWGRWHLNRQVKNPELRRKLTPDYTPGCKRVLLSNNYYPALSQPNVEVIDAGVREVRAHSVIDARGREVEVDAIVCGTGFDVADPLGPLQVYGRDGHSLRETYPQGLQGYYGITLHNAPNLFFLLGPNTGLGHNSIIFMIEAQIGYTLQCLERMEKKGTAVIEVRREAQARFNDDIQRELQGYVWSAGGCKSWYLDDNGRNFTLWPGFTWRYWLKTRRPRFASFAFEDAMVVV